MVQGTLSYSIFNLITSEMHKYQMSGHCDGT